MKKVIVLIGILLSTGCYAQVVSPYNNGKNQQYGVTYTLPKSVIEIKVEATQIKYTPGEFCKYADRYLRLSGVSEANNESWELNSIKAISIGVPDSAKTYFVKLKENTVAPIMELTEDGIIKSINITPEKKNVAVAPIIPAAQKEAKNPKDYMTEEMLMASSSAKMAELVAKEIYKIRESKNSFLRGEAENMPGDNESLKLILSKLDEQEQALTEMFSGKIEKETKRFTLRLVPSRNLDKEVLFRFSSKMGVVANNDLGGAPVYINLTDLKIVNVPVLDEKNAKKDKKKTEGIAYNVPGKAHVTIYTPKQKFFDDDLSIAQLGNVEYLAESMFEKKSTIKVIFNPITGGLIKVDRENIVKK